ncbi:MAG: hypothetical protein JWN65_1354, partial [Solirubrobacterales bacterium]|nr:hypothetical protein [Solirubrobacterales bacterium]
MSATPSTVTVTGPDRAALMANLTVRFGRVEIVAERQIALPGGGAGWELTVQHRPFVSDLDAGGNGRTPRPSRAAPTSDEAPAADVAAQAARA